MSLNAARVRPPAAAPTSSRQLLLTYLRPLRGQVSLLTVLLLGDIGLRLLNPQIMRQFIDTAMAGGALDTLMRLALIFLGVAFAQQVMAVAATYLSENLGWSATNALRLDLTRHCLNLDLSFHNAHTPGELIERIDGDVNALSNFFSRFIIQVVGNLLLLVGILVLLFREDWRAGATLLGFVLVALFVVFRFRNIAVPHWQAERQANADLFGFLEERLAGMEDIRANGGRDYVLNRFFSMLREVFQRSTKAALMVNILLNTLWTLYALGTAAAFAVGAYLFQGEVISIGTVYIIFQYTNMLQQPIGALSHELSDLQKALAAIVRIRQLFGERPRVQETARLDQAAPAPSAGPLELVFDQVTFGYDDSAPSDDGAKEMVLHDLSFCLTPGTVLGILGRTGSGKTSLTRLVFRLYDPDRGAIYLSPAGAPQPLDLRQVSLAQLRQQVGMVTQNIQLFNASVRQNLTFFNPLITDDQILNAIHGLGLDEWFAGLPSGLDTVLESGEGGLSAGEAQLLAFARIFLRDPGLVILDEASSRLDPATEALVERAVSRLVANRTAIIIAHRLATVQRADQILILQDGRMLEHGQRLDLANDPQSHFARLLRTGLQEVLA